MPDSAKDEDWIAHHRASLIQPYVRPTDIVLEYGAVDNCNLSALNAAKKLATPREGRADLSRAGSVSLDSVDQNSVDVALCYRVLEYTPEPVDVLVRLEKLLKPGGTLLVFALYDPAFGNPRLDEIADHFYSWNVQTLGNLLIDCGFELQSGSVERCINEKRAAHYSKGWRALSRFFTPEFLVRVTAKRP